MQVSALLDPIEKGKLPQNLDINNFNSEKYLDAISDNNAKELWKKLEKYSEAYTHKDEYTQVLDLS